MSSFQSPFRSASKKSRPSTPFSSTRTNVNDAPLMEFLQLIQDTAPDEWQIRTRSLQTLVATVPEEEYETKMWYNAPKSLRLLHRPLTALLKDPRSSVVKSTCKSVTLLFEKRRMYARLLFKELIPVILDVHGQTVNTIRTAVDTMTCRVLPMVPCKAGMPCMLERLRHSKSRTVRQACALYLKLALQHWTEPNYLSAEVIHQVGCALVKALRDASPSVRQEAKAGLIVLKNLHANEYNAILTSSTGPAAKDVKLQKYLKKLTQDGDGWSATASYLEDGSVTSGLSLTSKRSMASSSRGGVPAHGRSSPLHYSTTRRSPSKKNSSSVPTSVVVGTTSNVPTLNRFSKRTTNMGPPVRVATTTTTSSFSFQDDVGPSRALNFDTSGEDYSLGVQELKQRAKTRRSRRSSLLEEKLKHSSTLSLVEENAQAETTSHHSSTALKLLAKEQDNTNETSNGHHSPPSAATAQMEQFNAMETQRHSSTSTQNNTNDKNNPEHVMIAQQVLQAHQTHIDSIMETLRLEMDAMKDFESTVSCQMTEEEVVTYFDCIGLCLDQRTSSGRLLQREMNRISGIQEEEENDD